MVGIGNVTLSISEKIKGLQSGKFQDYAMAFISGSVIIAMIVFYLWL
jgi:NADH-quinone oxidoreductase subunit L